MTKALKPWVGKTTRHSSRDYEEKRISYLYPKLNRLLRAIKLNKESISRTENDDFGILS
jgi:hypothetical protein